MVSLTSEEAGEVVEKLLGDSKATHPDGTPLSHYFLALSYLDAIAAFHQVEQLPISERWRDLVYRMDIDSEEVS